MALKSHFSIVLVICSLILTSCTLPLFGTSPTVQISSPPTLAQTSGSVETLTVTLPVATVSVTNTSQPVPTNTSQPVPTVAPALKWNLIGVGCLTTTTIEISLSVGVPATAVTGICTGNLPCSSSSTITYACQLVPHKDGQAYCQGLLASSGSDLTACLQLPGSAQPACNTFANFQHYLAPCTCPSLYSTATACNADTNCKWDAVGLTCKKKP
jgi:hypothetical protein